MAKANAKAASNPSPNPNQNANLVVIADTDAQGGFSGAAGTADESAPVAATGPALTEVDHCLDGLIKVSGALFLNEAKDGEQSEGSPLMTGTLLIGETRRVGIAAWKRVAEDSGVVYAEICVGDRGKSKYYGRMFRNANREGNPSYGGFISLLPVERAKQYTPEQWEAAPKLDLFGMARRNKADGKVRIGLTFTDGFVTSDDVPF